MNIFKKCSKGPNGFKIIFFFKCVFMIISQTTSKKIFEMTKQHQNNFFQECIQDYF